MTSYDLTLEIFDPLFRVDLNQVGALTQRVTTVTTSKLRLKSQKTLFYLWFYENLYHSAITLGFTVSFALSQQHIFRNTAQTQRCSWYRCC
mmetsp:Transcript_1559/g.3250  ORF Transcript_1559/g.3250 Transcript_1559/m.3250 type:complete len:91 (-) Transcript_1559:405-677(-)